MAEHEKVPPVVQELANMVGGTIDSHGRLPDGSGFATMSMPLPKKHWLTADTDPETGEVPPMPLRVGVHDSVILIIGGETKTLTRVQLNEMVRAAGRYAMRVSTDRGKIDDMDPDALLQNLIVGLLGYHTVTGRSSDGWANP